MRDGNWKQETLDFAPDSGSWEGVSSRDRFETSLILSAVGDALGWPTETLGHSSKKKLDFSLPISAYVTWKKKVGGYWWGYYDDVDAGEYSDDTQLTLAVARSIDYDGNFLVERFAYFELPLWLQYERGGGRSLKMAARFMIKSRDNLPYPFYKSNETDYRNAGANGAAMRNLPVALSNVNNLKGAIINSFLNAITTHGHPRAIIGAILYAIAVRSAFNSQGLISPIQFVDELKKTLESTTELIESNNRISSWIRHWNNVRGDTNKDFLTEYRSTLTEVHTYLSEIPEYLQRPVKDYYEFTGALSSSYRGSGTVTTCVAIYLFLRFQNNVEEGIQIAASMLGSDTDTIASFVGGLLGITHGPSSISKRFLEHLQDLDYIRQTARKLHEIVFKTAELDAFPKETKLEKKQAYESLLAWEIGLRQMFWDAISEGDYVSHPALGRGKIKSKEVRALLQGGYEAKIVRVEFDVGQTCVFHSRVKENLEVSASLASDLFSVLNANATVNNNE